MTPTRPTPPDVRVRRRVVATLRAMQTARERVERDVRQAIDAHVPRLWRARAALYVPMIVDRIVAIVDELRASPDE